MYSCSEVIIVQLILQETGGMFKGIFKKTPKPLARTQSQVRVVRLTCLTCITCICIIFFCEILIMMMIIYVEYLGFFAFRMNCQHPVSSLAALTTCM